MANTQKQKEPENVPSSSSEATSNTSVTDETKDENPSNDLKTNDVESTDDDKEQTVKGTDDDETAGGSSDNKSESKKEEDSNNTTVKLSAKEENSSSDDTLIDVEDPDDYLLYLESILIKIHTRFYAHYDETKQVNHLICIFFGQFSGNNSSFFDFTPDTRLKNAATENTQ